MTRFRVQFDVEAENVAEITRVLSAFTQLKSLDIKVSGGKLGHPAGTRRFTGSDNNGGEWGLR